MPKGKAIQIVLSSFQRLRLEAELSELEEETDDHAAHLRALAKKYKATNLSNAERILGILRLKAILLAHDGLKNSKIADLLQVSSHTIGNWRRDYAHILSRPDLNFDFFCRLFLHYAWLRWYLREDPGVPLDFEPDDGS